MPRKRDEMAESKEEKKPTVADALREEDEKLARALVEFLKNLKYIND